MAGSANYSCSRGPGLVAVMSRDRTKMVVTDLDGTLLDSSSRLSPGNRETLDELAVAGIIRVVATGRSLWSALKAIDPGTPLDYLVFASGAGIVDWPGLELLHARHLPRNQALEAASMLRELGCDFMLHHSVPDNHRFWYHRGESLNPDFDRRLQRYHEHYEPWPDSDPAPDSFSQLLVIQHPQAEGVDQSLLRETMAPLSVIRTTSPLDHCSPWFEIFPSQVSKASGIQWLIERHGVEPASVLVIGNDFNDLEMLEWAEQAQVVANAPAELRRRFATVADNDQDGFSVAVRNWLAVL